MTQRLPTPGGDSGDWGDILNAFLEVSHASDGTLNPNTVGTSQLAANSVGSSQLQSGSVTTTQLAANSVTSSILANNSVGTTQLQPGSITTNLIANNAVTTTQLAANSVTSSILANNSVGTTQLQDAAVGPTQISTGAIGTDELADGSVTNAKLDTNTQTSLSNALTTSQLGVANGVAQLNSSSQLETAQLPGSVVSDNRGSAVGDVLTFNGTSFVRLPVGSTGQTLTVRDDGTAQYSTQSTINLRDAWQCKCDGAYMYARITAGSTTLTSYNNDPPAAAIFETTDVGKLIYVPKAGAGGTDLVTTIAAVPNPGTSSCTLATTAGTTQSGGLCYYGTNDLPAIMSAINAVADQGGRLELPENSLTCIYAEGDYECIDFGALGTPVAGRYYGLTFGGKGGSVANNNGFSSSMILNFNSGTAMKSYANNVTGLHLRDFTILCLTDIGQGVFALDWSNVNQASIKRVGVYGHYSGVAGGRGTDPNTGNGIRIDDPQDGQIVLENVVVKGFDSPPTTLAPPSGLNGSASSGGAFGADTYYWMVTAILYNEVGIYYETTGSNEFSLALTASQEVSLGWTAPSTAGVPSNWELAGYKIYRAITSGGETGLYSYVGQSTTTSYTDTGSGTSLVPGNASIGSVPPFNTAFTFAGSEGFRFGAEMPGPDGSNGNNSGNIYATACVSTCTVGYRFKQGALFNGATFSALKAVMDGVGSESGSGGFIAYWFEGQNQAQHVLNSPHAEGYQIGYWFNGSAGIHVNAPIATLPSGSAAGDGSTGFLFDNNAIGNNCESVSVGGASAFDYGVRFRPGSPWSTYAGSAGNKWEGRWIGTFLPNTAKFIRNGLNHCVDLNEVGWQALTLASNMKDGGSNVSGPPEVCLGRDGRVHFRGIITCSIAASAGQLVATLPTALIPATDLYMVCWVANSEEPASSDMQAIHIFGQGQGANAGSIELLHGTSASGNLVLQGLNYDLEPAITYQ